MIGKPSFRLKKNLSTYNLFQVIFLISAGLPVFLLIKGLRNVNFYSILVWGFSLFLLLYLFVLTLFKDKYLAYTLIIPAVSILFLVSIYPFVYSLRASFFAVSGINLRRTWPFIGLRNYISLFSDSLFWTVLIRTTEYLALAVTIELFAGLAMAILFSKVRRIFLSVFIIPMMIAPIVTGLLWKSMFNLENGFINKLLGYAGFSDVPWLTYKVLPIFSFLPQPYKHLAQNLNMTYGFFSILIPDIWQWTPLVALFLLAGIKSLPEKVFESAQMDGAGAWQTFRYITIPLLKPIITVTILIRMIDVLKVYEPIWAMFRTGIGVRTLNMQLTTYLFRTHDFGKGSALSIVVLLLVSIIITVFHRILYRRKETFHR
ncbi:hypothetical protein CEE35_00165 [Candidatus Aerophobetes bacterium Ae_b3b]|nr:MAG: hypothetical protein CEE35_00165 [Candidatus Aerophobetes bacterium Ae_b3b]